MANNLKCRKVCLFLLSLFILNICSSCMNLPGKERGEQEGSMGLQRTENNSETLTENLIRNPQNISFSVWEEPAAGPTVTPIILLPEKRGESENMIERPDELYDTESFTYDSQDYEGDLETQTQVRQAPAAVVSSGGMKDEMQVVGFNPFSGSVVLPNQALHLDITLKNTGTTTWQTSYKIVDYSNMAMTVQHEFNLPYAVAPGGTALISVYMAAPANMGSYPANFQIQDAYGTVFGTFDYILTVGAFTSVTDIPTMTPSVTPTYDSSSGITATPDSLAWMCIDPERSKLQDCYQFCVEYSHREEFRNCYYNGERYLTPVP